MTIAFLDAVTPPVAARATPQGSDGAANGAFGAVLASLDGAPTAPAEAPAAETGGTVPALAGAALPPPGKILPDLAAATGEAPGPGPEAGSDTPGTDDASGTSPVEADALPTMPMLALSGLTAPSVAVASKVREADGARMTAQPVDLGQTSASPDVDTQTAVPKTAQPAIEASKTAQAARPNLTIPPLTAQTVDTEPAPPSAKRTGESAPIAVPTLSLWDLSASLQPAAPVASGPVTVVSVASSADAGAAPVQTPAPAIALPDHRALVEALVRARGERDSGVSVALETREFGAVALRFEALQTVTGERSLQVAMSSSDPAFERAVSSAAAAQAALADQSGRGSPSRGEQPQPGSAQTANNPFGDAADGRASSSDPRSQSRSEPGPAWREPSRSHAEQSPHDLTTLPAGARRGGAIFA